MKPLFIALLLSASAIGEEFLLRWNANPESENITGYKVITEVSGSEPETLDVGLNTEAAIVFDASKQTVFYVKAYSSEGESVPSDIIKHTPERAAKNSISLNKFLDGTFVRIYINWDAGKNIEIQKSINLKDWETLARGQVGQDDSFLFVDGKSSQKAFYRVKYDNFK